MNFEEAKFKAIKFLGISKKTKYEVSIKLRRLNVDEEMITKVIEYLTQLKYVDDKEYIDSYIRQNERMLKYSIYEISEKLKAKGINIDILERSLKTLELSDYEKKVSEKIKKIKSKTWDEIKVKQYLYRRGFRNI